MHELLAQSAEPMSLPQTVYGVSIVYKRVADPSDLRHMAIMFVVSGRAPLTQDEAQARGERVFREGWPAANGPLSEWTVCGRMASWVVQG